MGKGWKNRNRNWGGGGKGGGGYQQHDFASCRGYGIILATCDAAKERETSKEMVNLIVEAIERVYPESLVAKEEEVVEEEQQVKVDKGSLSIADLMKQEISQVKAKKSSSLATAVSIKTDVKGIALVKLLKHEYCPIELVLNIFKKIETEKKSCCRYTVRLIPLKYVFFPKEEDFIANIEKILNVEMGIPIPYHPPKPVETTETTEEAVVGEKREREENEEASDDQATKVQKVETPVQEIIPVPVPPPAPVYPVEKIRYVLQFKARNHNVLVKNFVADKINRLVNGYAIADYRQAKVILLLQLQLFVFVFAFNCHSLTIARHCYAH